MKRKWWLLGIGVILIGGSAGGWMWFQDDEQPAVSSVATTEVMKGMLEVRISGNGSIAPGGRETVQVSTVGKVESVFFQEGDDIKKGDVLLTFEQENINAQIRSKELDLKKAQLDLEQLQLQYKQSAMEDTESQEGMRVGIQKAELTLQQLREDIASLKEEQGKSVDSIAAPIDGKLVTLDVSAGDNINQNKQIAEIVDYRSMEMVVSVDELDISQVELDQDAEVLVEAFPNKTFPGKVVEIAEEGTASNGVATFDVTILLSDIEGLKVGMSAEANVMTAQKPDALYLPIEAVQSFRNQYFVTVPAAEGERGQQEQAQEERTGQDRQSRRQGGPGMAGGGGTRIPVEVGLHTEDFIEIVSGLKEGDVVVLPAASANAQQQNVNTNRGGGGFGGGFPGGGGGGFPGGGGGGFQGGRGGGG